MPCFIVTSTRILSFATVPHSVAVIATGVLIWRQIVTKSLLLILCENGMIDLPFHKER
nr:MAG TPA: hypothetical protein [Caudoviricetes sp.]